MLSAGLTGDTRDAERRSHGADTGEEQQLRVGQMGP